MSVRCRRGLVGVLAVALLLATAACSPDRPRDTADRSAPAQTGSPATVPGGRATAVRRLVDTMVRTGVAPGVVVVLREGDDVRVLAAGTADRASGTPMTGASRFHAASLTKPMVATVVMQLVEQGELGLDDTVERWLPGVLVDGDLITVEQLLGQASGLPEYNRVRTAWPILKRPPVDQRALVVAAGKADPDFSPGSQQGYSNTNYAVLGMIVERVTGRSLEANLDLRVFAPAGMRSASLRRSRFREPPLAHGYVQGVDATGWDLTWGWAAAGLVSDAPDVDRFFAALFGGRLLRTDMVDEMAAPVAGDLGAWSGYGLGLARLATRCGEVVGHSGSVDGYVSAAYTRREDGRSVVVMVNTDRDLNTGLVHEVLETALCGP